jgi:hypothetical protein
MNPEKCKKDPTRKVKCTHCQHTFNTKSILANITCSSCQLKFPNPHVKVILKRGVCK